jgi:hypothetical protein
VIVIFSIPQKHNRIIQTKKGLTRVLTAEENLILQGNNISPSNLDLYGKKFPFFPSLRDCEEGFIDFYPSLCITFLLRSYHFPSLLLPTNSSSLPSSLVLSISSLPFRFFLPSSLPFRFFLPTSLPLSVPSPSPPLRGSCDRVFFPFSFQH